MNLVAASWHRGASIYANLFFATMYNYLETKKKERALVQGVFVKYTLHFVGVVRSSCFFLVVPRNIDNCIWTSFIV